MVVQRRAGPCEMFGDERLGDLGNGVGKEEQRTLATTTGKVVVENQQIAETAAEKGDSRTISSEKKTVKNLLHCLASSPAWSSKQA